MLGRHPARLFGLVSAHLEAGGWTNRGRSRDPQPAAARLCRCAAAIPAIPVHTFRPADAVAHWRAGYRRTCICWRLLPATFLLPFRHCRPKGTREPGVVTLHSREVARHFNLTGNARYSPLAGPVRWASNPQGGGYASRRISPGTGLQARVALIRALYEME